MDSFLSTITQAINPALGFVQNLSRDISSGNVLGTIGDVAGPALAVAGLPDVGGFAGNAIGSAGQFGDVAGAVGAPSSAAGFVGNAIGSAGQFGDVAGDVVSQVAGAVPGAIGGSDIIPALLGAQTGTDIASAAAPLATGGVTDTLGAVSQLPSQTAVDKAATSFFGGPTGAAAGDTAGTSGGILDFLKHNKDILVPAGMIGGQLIAPKVSNAFSTPIPNQTALKSIAGSAATAGNQLTPSLATGKLPPGAETFVSNQVNDAITAIKSRYASMGLSGSTMEQQDINRAQENAAALRFQLATQATQTGLQALGQAGQDYAGLAQVQLGEDQASQDAISRLLSALALAQGIEGRTAA